MAKTYTALASTVLGSPTATVTFSSISGSYTDLILRISAASSNAGTTDPISMTINSLSTNRTTTFAGFQSTSATSGAFGNTLSVGYCPAAGGTANTFGCTQIVIPNYANASYNKPFYVTAMAEINSASTNNGHIIAGLWSATSAITALAFTCSNNFVTGSRFDLFGVTHF